MQAHRDEDLSPEDTKYQAINNNTIILKWSQMSKNLCWNQNVSFVKIELFSTQSPRRSKKAPK